MSMADKFPDNCFGDEIHQNLWSGCRWIHWFLWNIWIRMEILHRTYWFHQLYFQKCWIAWADKYYCWFQWLLVVFNKVRVILQLHIHSDVNHVLIVLFFMLLQHWCHRKRTISFQWHSDYSACGLTRSCPPCFCQWQIIRSYVIPVAIRLSSLTSFLLNLACHVFYSK